MPQHYVPARDREKKKLQMRLRRARAKEGGVAKDQEIVDGFNPEKTIAPTRGDIKAGLAQVAEDEGGKRKFDIDEDDDRSSAQMLKDMRWVYRNVKGRSKLKLLVEDDDKQFVFMVKELMKIEASILAAKIRKEGVGAEGGVNQNFFVVLKGLEEDKAILEQVDKTVDMKQIARAMNPDGTEFGG